MRHGSLPHKIARHLKQNGTVLFRRGDLSNVHDDYDQIGRALRRLECHFHVERVGHGLWRALPRQQPQLEISRTWSKPDGVGDDTLIAATLANPSVGDLARLYHAFGGLRLRSILAHKIAAGEIHPETADLCRSMLDNIAKGAVDAYTQHAEFQV